MPLDNNDSAYIKPFIKNNEKLIDAMKQHQMHQSKLSPEQERLEGTVMPYAKDPNDYIKRR